MMKHIITVTAARLVAACVVQQTDQVAGEYVIESVRSNPWSLWHGVFYEPPIPSGGPLGSRHLKIPTNAVLKIGKEVKGFKLIAFEEKCETRDVHGCTVKLDVSELTIQRGNRTFKMQKGATSLPRDRTKKDNPDHQRVKSGRSEADLEWGTRVGGRG